MKALLWTFLAFIITLKSFVSGALNLDGSQAVNPVTPDDPAPIADINTYHPDQYDCPLACYDLSNIHKWTPYFSVERLQKCREPILLHFSVHQALDDPDTSVLIRSCTIRSSPSSNNRIIANATSIVLDNPKKSESLFQISLDVAPACAINGTKVNATLTLSASNSSSGILARDLITGVLDGMRKFFSVRDNCDEGFVFAYYKEVVAGIYIGPGLGKLTAISALDALTRSMPSNGPVANRTVAQVCGGNSKPENILGISIDTTGNLAGVQEMALSWSKGSCAVEEDLTPLEAGLTMDLFDIMGATVEDVDDNEHAAAYNQTRTSSLGGGRESFFHRAVGVHKRATCRYIPVVAGDGCTSLAAKCGIRGAHFILYNPKSDVCDTLQPGDYVCCSAGDPYNPSTPTPPSPNSDGTCASYIIQSGDTCAALAQTFGLTVDKLEGFNKGKTWAWTECKDILTGYNMCLSAGAAPLPPPQQGTECGPLVPGTKPPTDSSISLADLNPCPLKACCSNWGFCGPFPAHCDIHAPEGGSPGSKLPGFQSTCVANCGYEIKQNSGPPAAFQRVGYYSGWNLGRDCLWLKAANANTDGTYTQIYWAFADIDPVTWKPVLNDTHNQWQDFKKLENVKRVVSFGGWAYSTEPATYNILRMAIINNRETFATNIAKFIADEGIDGVDIDWEYPGVSCLSRSPLPPYHPAVLQNF